MLTGPMLPILALCLAIGAVAGPPVSGPWAVAVVPGEPATVLLHDRPTLQAVVADLDGSGSRTVVRLVQGEEGSVLVDVWRHDGSWRAVGSDVEVVPPGGERFDVAFDATPARLVVRRLPDRDRVTLVRQPRFQPPGLEPDCCLQLHDVVVGGGDVVLAHVGSAREAVDGVLALDLDGDGTDELLASRSLPPLGRTAYPSEVLVYRWIGERFAAPTLTELPVGSGNLPFVLGETDGRPGEEAGVIGTAAQSHLYRIVLDEGDRVRAEHSGLVARDVTAVSLRDGEPGVAVIGPTHGLSTHRWPSGETLGPPLATRSIRSGHFIGTVARPAGSVIVLEREVRGPPERLTLPDLRDAGQLASEAAATLTTATTVRAYRGPIPGGMVGGVPALLADGILATGGEHGEDRVVASLGDAQPFGLAGPHDGWLVVGHGISPRRTEPRGGRLQPVDVPTGGTLSLVPLDGFIAAEREEGRLEPVVGEAFVLDEEGTLGIPASGFSVVIEAPIGSRVHVGLGEGSTSLGAQTVLRGGRLDVRIPLPRSVLPYGGDLAWIAVVTPAGAAYVARWDVLALTGAPPLTAAPRTPIGSSTVEVRGETVPYAAVTVNGEAAAVDGDGAFVGRIELPPWPTDVEVVATDPVGNVARATVTGVGLLDYRALPWIPITVALLVAVAAVLYVRAPRLARLTPRAVDDDARLEDLDPEGET